MQSEDRFSLDEQRVFRSSKDPSHGHACIRVRGVESSWYRDFKLTPVPNYSWIVVAALRIIELEVT